MSSLQHVPNHTIDPDTGFLESNGYACAFDAERKTQFLKVFKENGLGLYRTCRALGIGHHTINKHYKNDQVFREAYDQVLQEYADELESVSRLNALNPKSVIERIFQLKSLFPSKYADQRTQSPTQITINVDGKMIEMMKKRDEIIEADVITSSQITDGKTPQQQAR